MIRLTPCLPLLFLLAAGCGTERTPAKTAVELCNNSADDDGDGQVDCDDSDCSSNVACRAATCGNGVRETGETCDGADLGGTTCASFGLSGGTLVCKTDCSGFNASGCGAGGVVCGNGVREGTEVCDGNDLAGQTCATRGFGGGTLACAANCATYVTSGCAGAQTCGNGTREGTEVCDGDDLANKGCADLGFTGGVLACASNCTAFDIDACTAGAACGNGVLDSGERCDGLLLDGASCESLGYRTGQLACNASCTAYNVSGCSGWSGCGNGALDGLEPCDGSKWGTVAGPSCESLGLGSGTATCTASCGISIAGCSEDDLCAAMGWYDDGQYCDACQLHGGTVDPDCATLCGADGTCAEYFDIYAQAWVCRAAGYLDPDCGTCGNGVVDDGELCDGTQFGAALGSSCADWGYAGGVLGCRSDCTPNFSQCTATVCGDGSIQGYELCDGGNLGGVTCEALGFETGLPTCASSCLDYDTAGCTGIAGCGNGVVDGFERCDKNGTTMYGSSSCAAFFLGGGTVSCTSTCALDVSGCDIYDEAASASVPADFCELYGYYGDGEFCDPCEALGGHADPDCAALCGANGVCADYWSPLANVWTCRSKGLTDPDCGVCGNGLAEGYEHCDGLEANANFSVDCVDYGYAGGTLACRADCSFNFGGCTDTVCGDGQLQGYEVCDGSNFGTASCQSFGFKTGTLACGDGCQQIDTSGCRGPKSCGNNRLDPFEQCDGTRFATLDGASGSLCSSYKIATIGGGLGTGNVTCNSDCTVNFSACSNKDPCSYAYSGSQTFYGDGVCDLCELYPQGSVDPDCSAAACGAIDGWCSDFFDMWFQRWPCQHYGFADPDCGFCGNGYMEFPTLNPEAGEFCDGSDLGTDGANSVDCTFYGMSGGTLRCRNDCMPDVSQCTP